MNRNLAQIIFTFFVLPSVTLLFISNPLFAQLSKYDCKRKLERVEKEGWYSIELTPEILAKSVSALNDIRLYRLMDKDAVEIPYLLEWLGNKIEEKEVSLELINNTYIQKCCSYVTLKFHDKRSINKIRLEVAEEIFDKTLKIEGSVDNVEWFTIKENLRIVGFRSNKHSYKYTTLDFPLSEYNYFRLVFDDEHSPRVTVVTTYAYETHYIEGSYCELGINEWEKIDKKDEKTTEIIMYFHYKYFIDNVLIEPKIDKVFYRNLNIYYPGSIIKTPKGDIENWTLLNTTVFSSKETKPIDCHNIQANKIKVEIINNDNVPLEIVNVKAFGEECRLVAQLPVANNLFLVYGKDNERAPRYDLIHFKDKIPPELKTISLGSEIKIEKDSGKEEKKKPLLTNKLWLWGSMMVIIILIAFFSFKMITSNR